MQERQALVERRALVPMQVANLPLREPVLALAAVQVKVWKQWQEPLEVYLREREPWQFRASHLPRERRASLRRSPR